ncbi:NUMOD4 domain-containing protein [Fibrella aestuarina]|uniref:NUMOD4 domain-containing protein n=1 Tax=Fibrella aestuarina TaxID=651143 RepID=UPI000686C8F3|nr:NUMOD4 domain-containing protein [Fibrella aestuarina]
MVFSNKYHAFFVFLYMEEQNEIWKDIAGFEGLYQISNMGNVASLRYGFKLKTLQRKKANDAPGYYLQTQLVKPNEKVKMYLVHRLVATHFLPNPNNKPHVNHKNGVKHDNTVANLEWATARENSMHAHKSNLSKPRPARNRKLTDEQANQIRMLYSAGVELSTLGRTFGLNLNGIKGIVDNKIYTIQKH